MEAKAKKRSLPIKKSIPKPKKDIRDVFGSPVFILAGEHSGDLLGGDLLRELKSKSPGTHFFGIGGEEMIEQGLESLESLENLSVVGFAEIIKKYSFLKKLFDSLVAEILSRECQFVILIDYPGFNLRLAKELQKHDIQVLFYVSPQIWAWKFKRIFHIRENINLMLTLFQFEEDLYREYGVNAYFVGHPLPHRIQESLKNESPLPKTIDKSNEIIIGLLPGSRKQEIHNLMQILLDAAVIIDKHFAEKTKPQKVHFLIPNINSHQEAFIKQKIEAILKKHPNLSIDYIFQASSQVMEISDVLILASGTATLEGVYWEKPMVVLYKVSLFTYFLGSLLLKTANIGLVNILAGKEICRELLQSECKPKFVAAEAISIVENKKYRKKITDEVLLVKERELSVLDGAKRAANKILEYVKLIHSN
ncbi:MAG: lipid-A-disaccharide synthase [Leptospira sp.]|nr:lipid-A-disaccharide synthase [Leptospira sp.]